MNKLLSFRHLAAAVVIGACGVAASATVNAQATAGVVFGNAPAGDSVSAININNATQREVKVDARGRYALRALPVGTYTITLIENGQPVVKHANVPVVVGRGIKVNFDCTQGHCAELATKQ